MLSVPAMLVERIVSGVKSVLTTFVAIVKRKVLLMCVRFVDAGRVHGVANAISGSDRAGFLSSCIQNSQVLVLFSKAFRRAPPHHCVCCGAALHNNSGCFILRQSKLLAPRRIGAWPHKGIVLADFRDQSVEKKNLTAHTGIVKVN